MAYVEAAATWIGSNAAVIVALCALAVATYQVRAIHRHNRLSVRPHIVLFTDRHNDVTQGTFTVRLRNNGLGPAIIKACDVLLDDEPTSIRDASVVLSTITTVIGRPPSSCSYHRLATGDAIAKDQELTLLSVRFTHTSKQDCDAVLKSFERLSSKISYVSMYDESYVYDSRTAGT